MPEAYSKPCQISRMMRHIENPGIVKTVYSCIFRDINNIQPCSDISSDIKAYSGIFKHCWGSWSHIQTFRTMCNPCIWVKVFENGPSKICERQPLKNLKLYGLLGRPIYIFAIFKTGSIFKSLSNMWDDQAYSEPWHTKNITQAFLRMFRDI